MGFLCNSEFITLTLLLAIQIVAMILFASNLQLSALYNPFVMQPVMLLLHEIEIIQLLCYIDNPKLYRLLYWLITNNTQQC